MKRLPCNRRRVKQLLGERGAGDAVNPLEALVGRVIQDLPDDGHGVKLFHRDAGEIIQYDEWENRIDVQ